MFIVLCLMVIQFFAITYLTSIKIYNYNITYWYLHQIVSVRGYIMNCSLKPEHKIYSIVKQKNLCLGTNHSRKPVPHNYAQKTLQTAPKRQKITCIKNMKAGPIMLGSCTKQRKMTNNFTSLDYQIMGVKYFFARSLGMIIDLYGFF